MLEQVHQLSAATLPLNFIYLDPNNPRFSDDEGLRIPDNDTDGESLQEQLMNRLEREFGVGRLTDSIESNGYLPIDRIVVRQFKENKYVVLEGNRRITAAKRLWSLHESGQKPLDSRVADSLREIPTLIYVGSDPDAAWVFQGLRHISGIKDWSAYNKARLLVKQMEEHSLSLSAAGKLFGISAVGAGQWVRGYYTYRQISDHPDYDSDLTPRIFPYLQELFGRSNIALKDWLGWNESESKFNNLSNFDEFLSWFYPKTNEQGEFDPDIPGDWDKRRIPTTLDLRGLSDLISEHSDEFQAFRQGTPLNRAVARALAKEEEEESETTEHYAQWIEAVTSELGRIPVVQIIAEGKRELISRHLDALSNVLSQVQRVLGHE